MFWRATQPKSPSRAPVAALEDDVLAMRVPGGVVPPGALGLSLNGNEWRAHLPGDTVTVPKAGMVWWIRSGITELRLAPDPGAPDAGVAIQLEPWIVNDQPMETLKSMLRQHRAERICLENVRQELAGFPFRLFPGVQHDELEACGRRVKKFLADRGFRYVRIDRCDLYDPEHSLASTMWEGERDGAPGLWSPPEAAVGAGLSAVDVGAGNAEAFSVEELSALDAAVSARLFKELRSLASLLNAKALPNDSAGFKHLDSLQKRMDLLAFSVTDLPALDHPVFSRPLVPLRKRLYCLESQRVGHALDGLWAAVEGPGTHLTLTDYRTIATAMDEVEAGIKRRRVTWWTDD